MTEHFTREEAVALAKQSGIAVDAQSDWPLFLKLCNAAVAAYKLKGWDVQGAVTAQGDKAYKRGFSDGMKEAPTGESWIRAIDEAMVGAHIGVAEMADDYGTAKKKLNALICWSVQVDRDLSRAQAAPAVGVPVFPERIMRQLTIMADRVGDEFHGPWEDGDGEPLQDDAEAAIAWIASAQPQQKEG